MPATGSRSGTATRASPSLTSVGFLLHLALARLHGAVMEAVQDSGLSGSQLAVLGALAGRGGMGQRQLGAVTLIEKSTMVLLVDGLEDAGWVRRVRSPDDRRVYIVKLTDEGARKFSALGPRLLEAQQRFLEQLDETEVRAFRDMLERLGAPNGPGGRTD